MKIVILDGYTFESGRFVMGTFEGIGGSDRV